MCQLPPIKLTLIIYLFKCLAGLLSRKALYKGSQKMEKAGGKRGKERGKEAGKGKSRAKEGGKAFFQLSPNVSSAYIYLYSELSVVKTEKII